MAYNFDWSQYPALAGAMDNLPDPAEQYNQAGRPNPTQQRPTQTRPIDNPANYLGFYNQNIPKDLQNSYNPFLQKSLQLGIHHPTRNQSREILGDQHSDQGYTDFVKDGLQKNPFNQAAKDSGISLQQSQANALRNTKSTPATGGNPNG